MDKVVTFVKSACKKTSFIKKAWLFGSRASGKATEKSDYDFAFECSTDEIASGQWGKFCGFLREKNPTLNTLDLVKINEVNAKFRKKILSEGKIIYEQP